MREVEDQDGALVRSWKEPELQVKERDLDAARREADDAQRQAVRRGGGTEESTPRSRACVRMQQRVPSLPAEIWALVASDLDQQDVFAFAASSRLLRQAQRESGRRLVTHCKRGGGRENYLGYSEAWAFMWSHRFHVSETREMLIQFILRIASANGYVKVLRHWEKSYIDVLAASKFEVDPPFKLWDRMHAILASQGGHLESLEFLRKSALKCPMGKHVCVAAAEQGHLSVLEWAAKHRMPLIENACFGAARGGHVAVLRWLREQDPPCPWTAVTTAAAARAGHLDILKLAILELDPPCVFNEFTFSSAVDGLHLDCIEWLLDQGCATNHTAAFRKLSDRLIQRKLDLGLPRRDEIGHELPLFDPRFLSDEQARRTYVLMGRLIMFDLGWIRAPMECLSWHKDLNEEHDDWIVRMSPGVRYTHTFDVRHICAEHGVEIGERLSCALAKHGWLDFLRWMHRQDPPLDLGEKTCEAAIIGHQLDTLVWLLEQGCPWNRERCRDLAYEHREDLAQGKSSSFSDRFGDSVALFELIDRGEI